MKIIYTAIICLMAFATYAQRNLTLYHMKSVPQSIQVNPANKPDAKFYFGLPGFSSLDFNHTNNGLSARKLNAALIPVREGSDSFRLDINKALEMFDKSILQSTSVTNDWLNAGFSVGNSFFSATVTEKVKLRTEISRDLFDFMVQGNGGDNLGRTFNFKPSVDAIWTREYAIGYQHSLSDDRLRIGGRIKYIYGLAVAETKRNDINLTTDEDDFSLTLNADIKMNIASSVFSLDSNEGPPSRYLLGGSGNQGWGLDLGGSFDLNDQITLSASILDIGQIRWKENLKSLKSVNPNATFEFRGFDANNFFGDSSSIEEGLKEVGDSLVEAFNLEMVDNSAFTTGLLTEFYLGGNFHVTESHNAGILFYGNFYNQKLYPALTLSWNSRIAKVFAFSISYSMMRGNYANMGTGLSFNGGSFQFYIVGDNMLGMTTGGLKNVSIRTGINFTFGRRSNE